MQFILLDRTVKSNRDKGAGHTGGKMQRPIRYSEQALTQTGRLESFWRIVEDDVETAHDEEGDSGFIEGDDIFLRRYKIADTTEGCQTHDRCFVDEADAQTKNNNKQSLLRENLYHNSSEVIKLYLNAPQTSLVCT